MAYGFRNQDFAAVEGWCLEQVTLDKYHVMFWFNSNWGLLNIAHAFSYRSADDSVAYRYEIYGAEKMLNVDRILRVPIKACRIARIDSLELEFENGDIITVHDHPEFRSWWFMGGWTERDWNMVVVNIGDLEPEDMTDSEVSERRA